VSRGPALMGVVNASPNSFSDAGRHPTTADQVRLGRALAEHADWIDVGGESGVTVGTAVDLEEETARVVPVVRALAGDGIAVSVDTWKAEVARAALAAGATMVNDVSGLSEPALAEACAEHAARLVVTYTRVEPKVKGFPHVGDPVEDALAFLAERTGEAVRRGVPRERLVVDPGPDLGKTPADTVALLRAIPRLRAELGLPVLLAVSRKDFLGQVTGRPPRERLASTLAAVGEGVDAGVALVRVHDVREVADFLRTRAVLRGEEELPAGTVLPDDLRREAS
jgi:dihydropteroate synthase